MHVRALFLRVIINSHSKTPLQPPHGLGAFLPLFAALLERLTSSETSSSPFTDSGADGFGAATPPPAGFFFAAAVSLARAIPFCFNLSSSCFRPAAVVGMAGRSMLRGSEDLGVVVVVVEGREEGEGLLGFGVVSI